jgi:ATP-dependent RNA helicase DDX52/ROK1
MFSATFTKEVEDWSKLELNNLIKITIGIKNTAHKLIEQEIQYVYDEYGKLYTLRNKILKDNFVPPILIFVQSIERSKQLFKELIYDGFNVDLINSERTQKQRDNTIRAFRQGKIWLLICTELMGRGIDFKGVNLVINYDFPQSTISYIHRIGRTGRAGRTGKAITLFTNDDFKYLKLISNVMIQSGCNIPEYMFKLNKPNKKLKKQLLLKAPKRKNIIIDNQNNDNNLIKKNKHKNEDQEGDDNENDNHEDKQEQEEEEEEEKEINGEGEIKKRKKSNLMRIRKKIKIFKK